MKKIPHFLYIIGGLLITITTLYGYHLYRQRVGLPPEIRFYAEKHKLVRIEGIEIKTDQDDEFILCRRKAGETVAYHIKENGQEVERQASLVAIYSQTPYPLINLGIGIFLIVMAFVVYFLRPRDIRARLFFWASLFLSCAQTVNGGFYCLQEGWLSFTPGILFFISYVLAPTIFLQFCLTFLASKPRILDYLIYVPAAIFIILLEYFFLLSSLTSSLDAYRKYQSVFVLFRCFLLLYILCCFVVLILSNRRAYLEEQKAQIKWIIYGLFFGSGPLIVCYQLPRILSLRPLISEELAGAFLIFIPVAFAVSIIRFNLMDIQLVINRSLVYSILTVFTVGFYLLSVQVIQSLFARLMAIKQTTVSLIGAFAVALAFNPARKKIQEFVDRSFFRVSYDYKKSILSFNERAHKIASLGHLVDFFLAKVDKTIPLHGSSLCVISFGSGKQKILVERGLGDGCVSFEPRMLESNRILARRKGVLTELGMDFSFEKSLEENNWEMVVPLPFRTTSLGGIVALGKKKSGSKFSGDDIELILTMAETFSLNCERIHLQEEVIYERAEKEKFDELNRLKTEFITSVSHEIRTPMSSIQGMSEILQQGKIKVKKKQEEIFDLMAGECSRLSRFLHNILDYGKIEQDVKTYYFLRSDISRIVEDILKLYEHRFRSLGFSVETELPQHPIWLDIDPDGVKQALTNLIDNAMKYSSDKREIRITLIGKSDKVEIMVQDRGIGIPDEDCQKIFEGFHRIPDAQKMNPKGVGLGLKITKHIMEAHGGEIRIESRVGEGSTFSLIFPR
jgi:signal transduction histidine kinase